MVLLSSLQVDESFLFPKFSLSSVDDKKFNSELIKSSSILVMFICNHCPYVKAIEDRIIALRKEYTEQDLCMIGICSNDPSGYDEDSKENLYKRWREKSYGFPYLIDDDGKIGKIFNAVCTPDFFLFDKERKLFYRGRLDDSWQDAKKVTSYDLKNAINAVLKGEKAIKDQKPSMGCSIKWAKI